MLEFHRYLDRSIVGFALLAVVGLVALVVLLPMLAAVVEAAQSFSLDIRELAE